MSISNFLRRHAAVLLYSAVFIAPFVLGVALKAGFANAETASPAASITPAANTSYAPIVAADKPAVVTITSIMKGSSASDDGTRPPMTTRRPTSNCLNSSAIGGIPVPKAPPARCIRPWRRLSARASSSAPDGTIVTNNHVIDGASDIKVTLDDGTELKAILVGRDAKSDLAVLKVSAGKPLPTVAWGDSDKLRAGDQILAIGNPFGIGTTVTAGIISARGRDLHSGPYDDFLQVDAPINRGNSGGPLVDTNGTVVGINTAIYSPNGGSVGVGFAIPSQTPNRSSRS